MNHSFGSPALRGNESPLKSPRLAPISPNPNKDVSCYSLSVGRASVKCSMQLIQSVPFFIIKL